MLSDIGNIISSTFSSPLTKTLIGSATEIAKGSFNSQVIAQQIVAIAKESPKINLNEQQVKNVVDLIRDETLRIGAKSMIDLPKVDGPAIGPMIQPQAAPANGPDGIAPVQPAPIPQSPASAQPIGPTIVSPKFKLIFLTVVGVTVVSAGIAIAFSLIGGTLNSNEQTVFNTCIGIVGTGTSAMFGLIGGKAT